MADCLALLSLEVEAASSHLVISSRSANCCFLSFPICLTFPDSQPLVAPMFCIHVFMLSDVSFGQSSLKDETTDSLETLRTKYPLMHHYFPEEWLPHNDMYCQSPQCSHSTVVQKIVAEYQEQGKPRNEGYLYNSNQLTWSTNTEGHSEEI
jgi:hypothetical protein